VRQDPCHIKKVREKCCSPVPRSAVDYHNAPVARHVARGETVQNPGQPEAARPAACMSHLLVPAPAYPNQIRRMSCSRPLKTRCASRTQSLPRLPTSPHCCRCLPARSPSRASPTKTRRLRPSTSSTSSRPTSPPRCCGASSPTSSPTSRPPSQPKTPMRLWSALR
jgi:hypothetical protein